MATVTITITDAPGGVTAVVESKPHVPMLDPETPDVDAMTAAQAFTIGVLMQMSEMAPDLKWQTLIVD